MSDFLLLAASVAPLALAPVLFRATTSRPTLARALDGFVVASIALLVLIHLVPHSVEAVGSRAILVALLGLATPLVLERVNHVSTRRAHGFALVLAMMGLVLHTLVDGMALASSTADAGDPSLATAVLVHRLPVGLAVWWLVRPRYGAVAAWTVLGLEAIGTFVGFYAVDATSPFWAGPEAGLFQAFVAGMLMHVLFHVPGAHGHDHGAAEDHGRAHDRGRGAEDRGHVHAHDHGHQQDHAHQHDHGHQHDHAHHDHAHHDGASDVAHAASCSGGCAQGCSDDAGEPARRPAWAEALGAVCGVALVAVVGRANGGGHDHEHGFGERFLELSLESAPALVLGFLLAGVVSVFLPKASASWLRSGTAAGQALKGVAFGLPLPICSCGVVPMYQSLVRTGAPPTAAMAFLVATPEIGVEAIVLSIPFLGPELTALRLVAAAAVAMTVGLVVGRRVARAQPVAQAAATAAPAGSIAERWGEALRFGFVEIVDETAAWLLVGIAIAAAIEPAALTVWLENVPSWAEVAGFAALGLPIYVCASGATPLAAAMILAGASPGAALAFLIAGPATNATTYGVLAKLHGRGSAVLFAAVVFGAAVACGVAVDALFGGLTIPSMAGGHTERGSALAWACLVILGLAFAAAIVRQGPRAFLSTVIALGGEEEHEHD